MYPSLMGTFKFSTPILTICSSIGRDSSSLSSVPFHILHLEDTWIFPSLSTLDEDPRPTEMEMSLSIALVSYQDNIGPVVDLSPSSSWMEEYPYVIPSWEFASYHSHDCFDDIFSMDEAILEDISGIEQPWGDLHHRYYFLPKLDRIECDDYRSILSEKVDMPVVPLGSPSKYAKGNMANFHLLYLSTFL